MMFPAASSTWSQTSSSAPARRYMSSRSKGVTNVRLRRSTTSRVTRSPSCSSSLISRRRLSSEGNSSSNWMRRREISTALADARANSSKNSRFCGTSEIRAMTAGCYQIHATGADASHGAAFTGPTPERPRTAAHVDRRVGDAVFDVLCVTDHTVRLDDPSPRSVDGWSWPGYIDELGREAERARDAYDLLLVPGLELSDNRDDPDDSAHVLALGLHRFVSVERGIVDAILGARAEGAAIVGAHPYSSQDWTPLRPTRRLARERDLFRGIIDRWELANRTELFGWVAEERLPWSRPATFTLPMT